MNQKSQGKSLGGIKEHAKFQVRWPTLGEGKMNFPDKVYQIIYADLPLTYNDKALAGNRGAGCKYDLMTDEELLKIIIKC